MMRILLLSGLWGGYAGGLDRYIGQVSHLLHGHGHEVALIYGRRRGAAQEEGLPLRGEYELPGLEGFPDKSSSTVPAMLLELVTRIAPDVVFVQDIRHYLALDALQQEWPVVHMLHDYRSICLKDTRRDNLQHKLCDHPLGWHCVINGHFLRRPAAGSRWPRLQGVGELRRLLAVLGAAPQTIVASDHVRSAYLRNGYPPERIDVLPLFTTMNHLDIAKAYPREKIVLFVGRLTDRYKGADDLLEALSLCRSNVRLYIAGAGGFAQRLQKLCARYELTHRVKFLGWLKGEELQQAYRQAMVLVVPSLWAEPFGLVGLEAMANGTPVIAYNVGGIPQWLRENVTGFLVPFRDRRALADKIDLLAANPVMVRQFGLDGRDRVRSEFSESLYLEGLLAIFNRAVARFHQERGAHTSVPGASAIRSAEKRGEDR